MAIEQSEELGDREINTPWRVDNCFSQLCAKWRSNPAIDIDGLVITYGELDRYSNQLSRKLTGLGVGRGDIVAIVCDDIFQFAMGALSILKSGAAYVAIDARYPMNRSTEIFRQGAPKLVIGSERRLSLLPQLEIPTVLDAYDLIHLSQFDGTAIDPVGCSSDAAYICYTSGTSGQPKGVIIAHSGIRGLVTHPEFDLFTEGSRVASCMTFSFDAIAHEVWGSLLNGSCLVETPPSVLQSPWDFASFLKTSCINGALLSTSLFNAIVSRCPEAFGDMQCVVIGGEAVDPAYVEQVFAAGYPPRRLVNGYGPTETTALATCHTISAEDVARGMIPIGRPFSGRCLRIMASPTVLAGDGEDGELWIGGPAVGLGYLGNPILTAEKFVSDPFSSNPSDRFYRTGDLCRMLPNGTIQFLGRIDEQIKVRGYRIEPAGIGAILMGIAGIEEAVVLARTSRFGTKELLAFVRGDNVASPFELRAQAAKLMPDYMLPVSILWVDKIPLNVNGKVDRDILFSHIPNINTVVNDYDTIYSDIEWKLLQLWKRNWARADLGIDNDYREWGGDSLSILGLMIDVENEFGVRLSFADLEPPLTIRSMAATLAARKAGAQSSQTPPAASAFLISHPWSMFRYPKEIGLAMAGGGPFKQVQIPPASTSNAVYNSIESMALVLLDQIIDESPTGPYVLAGHSFAGILAFELAQQLEARGKIVSRLILIDSFIYRYRTRLDRLWMVIKQSDLLLRTDRSRLWNRIRFGKRRFVTAGVETFSEGIFNRCGDAMNRYDPRPYNGDVVLFYCDKYDDILDIPEYSTQKIIDPWWKCVRGGIDSYHLEGSHSDVLITEKYYSYIADRISRMSV